MESLIALARTMLEPHGSLAFVAPAQRDSEIDLLLTLNGFRSGRSLRVKQRDTRPAVRTFRQMRLSEGPVTYTDLILNNADGSRTAAYNSLTDQFYL